MRKNQTYKNLNYDFSDYAEKITGNALFEINTIYDTIKNRGEK